MPFTTEMYKDSYSNYVSNYVVPILTSLPTSNKPNASSSRANSNTARAGRPLLEVNVPNSSGQQNSGLDVVVPGNPKNTLII